MNCQVNIYDCGGNHCQNGGVCTTCKNTECDYECVCVNGFHGKNCDTAPKDSTTLIGILGGVIVLGLVLLVLVRKPGHPRTASHILLDLEPKHDINLI